MVILIIAAKKFSQVSSNGFDGESKAFPRNNNVSIEVPVKLMASIDLWIAELKTSRLLQKEDARIMKLRESMTVDTASNFCVVDEILFIKAQRK